MPRKKTPKPALKIQQNNCSVSHAGNHQPILSRGKRVVWCQYIVASKRTKAGFIDTHIPAELSICRHCGAFYCVDVETVKNSVTDF